MGVGVEELDSEGACSPHHYRLIAVIPAFNEERFIAGVVLIALKYASVVVVVDDGSTDRTAEMAKMAGAVVIRMGVNGGKGKAVNLGFRHALARDPDVVVMLDADSQHDAAEIPTVVAPILAGRADVVVGSRFLEIASDVPAWRRAGQQTLTAITNRGSGVSVTDSQSGYRAFTPEALEQLHFHTDGLSMESEMQFQIERASLRVTEVPIKVHYLNGNRRNPVVHGLEVLDATLGLMARRRPIMFVSVPGVVLAVTGMLLGLLVASRVLDHHPIPVGTAITSALLVIVGSIMTMTGVVLHTIGHAVTRVGQEVESAIARLGQDHLGGDE